MSFVLDALRKSEQERQQATAPGLGVLFPAIVEERSASTTRPLLIAAMAATAIAALLWFLLRPQGALPGNSPAPTALPKSAAVATAPELPKAAVPAVSSPVSPPPEVSNTIAVAALPKAAAKPPEAIAAAVSASDKSVLPNRAATESANKDTTKVARSTFAAKSPESAPTAAAPPPPVDSGAGHGSAKNLPEMTIAGYIHDDQAGSMAMINDKLIREGEEVSPGLRLEKILPDGAIFSYRGERFRR